MPDERTQRRLSAILIADAVGYGRLMGEDDVGTVRRMAECRDLLGKQVDRHGGRVASRAFLEGIFVEKRLAVILTTNDTAGAIARDEFGQWEYNVGVGGDTTREMSFRLGVNLVMYSLCLNYKEDQVHIPYILKRRR